ncbi:MAG: cytochrome c oxidase subunit 3 family protein [Sphingobacteriia bacterium]|jgi:nitric oxide reductase NorE protein|nr:cytochrome c oxidase subunit 3 family protein [Sphingobacteriia bacterium]
MARQQRLSSTANPPGTDGIWTFVFIDMIVFSLFFIVYLSERLRLPDVFAASQARLDPNFGLVNTLVLLTSSLFMAEAVAAARTGNAARVKTRLALTLGCGAMFAVSKITEYSEKFAAGITPVTNSFYSFYFLLTMIHFLHVLVGMMFIAHCLSRARVETGQPGFSPKLENTGLFWHFVDLLWLFLFPLLYLAGLK